ncbi:MAG: hypothetical protein A3F72_17345 [Bacteroidetes bacterium RIFCSPLOWO2_12_FULL_35_15]|nr:MAG: hypothetical protein A3F72_17345 [Bacteroidetes bacterium RIFCSPLOWO2_12_FULL_35_15]
MKILLIILIFILFPYCNYAQCPATAITFTADLSSKPDTAWQSIITTRNGLVCGDTDTINRTVAFIVTVNPLTTHVNFNIIAGTIGGTMYYRINCGQHIPLGTPSCVSGLTTFCLSFSKPGTGNNIYEINAIKNVNLITIDTSTTINSMTLTSNQTGASYQWLDCANAFAPILNETNQNYTATANGDYSVAVIFGGCIDTSACVNINSMGIISEITNSKSEIIVYPNPTTDILNIEYLKLHGEIVIEIENILRQTVYTIKTKQTTNTIDVSVLQSGLYYLKVKTGNGSFFNKIIVE